VAYAEKESARILTRHALSELDFGAAEKIVRINGLDTPFWKKDLRDIVPARPDTVMAPKIHCAADIRIIGGFISEIEIANGLEPGGIKLIALIESARGIESAPEIAKADPRVVALYLGAEDLALNLKAKRTAGGEEILYSRSRLVMAARAAGIDALDTPFLNTQDHEGLAEDARRARNLGFNGKAAIYPMQIDIINEVFSPTRAEYDQAREILDVVREAEARGRGVSTYNGKLLDGPLITMAENVVREYETIGGRP
jgi:citrate lyase subunit beta/citryl-CoA lyase